MTKSADRAVHENTHEYSVLVGNIDRRKTTIITERAATLVSSNMHVPIALQRGYTLCPILSVKKSCYNYTRAHSLPEAN